ncbi:MAG: FUSC family protein [Firmicutes bacterium]|uniref:Integral membrane bound transporter domain-containing protein n=1 Tax=Sulfobacillus benefaciens TaxID=453960 RepID=A0A2T2X6J8_9FIRM|nr:FUSC family protein [Bacillota bacterium]PSR30078.1 MAG: hypothetical protein C7B43_07285 [Sulfobacillus benefaciens]
MAQNFRSHRHSRDDGPAEIPQDPSPWHQGFVIKKAPVPWRKLWGMALTTIIGLGTGILLDHLTWGFWAFMGGLTSLYVANDPYSRRALLLFFVALGLAVAMGLGAWSREWWEMALALGFVGFAATFFTGAWGVPLPAGFMFILVACISAALPHSASVPLRILFVLYGGFIAWIIGMIGWPFRPRRPEQMAVRQAYFALAEYVSRLSDKRSPGLVVMANKPAQALKSAESQVATSLRWYPHNAASAGLVLLTERAETIFQEILREIHHEGRRLPPEVPGLLRQLGERAINEDIPEPFRPDENPEHPKSKILSLLYRTLSDSSKNTSWESPPRSWEHPNWQSRLLGSLSFRSMIHAASLRMTIAIVISVMAAYVLGNPHPYWVPLTVGAVLQGPTVVMMAERAIQRAVGTTIGLVLAAGVMAIHPTGLESAILVVVFQILMLLFIARNYGISVIFITTLALVIIEASAHVPPSVLITARFEDTLLGVAIAVLALFVLWPRHSSQRVTLVMGKTILDEGHLLQALLGHSPGWRHHKNVLLSDLLNLSAAVDNALGELPRPANVDELWIKAWSVMKMGYYLLGLKQPSRTEAVSSKTLNEWGKVFHMLGEALCDDIPVPDIQLPPVNSGGLGISTELENLIETLRLN